MALVQSLMALSYSSAANTLFLFLKMPTPNRDPVQDSGWNLPGQDRIPSFENSRCRDCRSYLHPCWSWVSAPHWRLQWLPQIFLIPDRPYLSCESTSPYVVSPETCLSARQPALLHDLPLSFLPRRVHSMRIHIAGRSEWHFQNLPGHIRITHFLNEKSAFY